MTETTTPKSPALEAAEIAKLEAEAAALLAKAAQDKAITIKEQRNADVAAIQLAERVRVEELTLVQDHYQFHHTFDGPVNSSSVYGLLNTMSAWHRMHPDSDWTIDINSPGGSVISGMHLFDQLVAYSRRGGGTHHITMTVRGYAASMAGILLQTADVRRIGPESYLMIHEISAGTGGKIGEIKDDVKWYEKLCERVANIFVVRAAEAVKADKALDTPHDIKGIVLKDFKKGWERTDWWLDSIESLKLGFVDEIG